MLLERREGAGGGQIYQSLPVDGFGPERSLERGKMFARVLSSPGREGRAVAGEGDRSSSEREQTSVDDAWVAAEGSERQTPPSIGRAGRDIWMGGGALTNSWTQPL